MTKISGILESSPGRAARVFSFRPLAGLDEVDGVLNLPGKNGFDDGYLVQVVPTRGESSQFLLSKIRDDEADVETIYEVTLWSGGSACTCKDSVCRKRVCKHSIAMRKVVDAGAFVSRSNPG